MAQKTETPMFDAVKAFRDALGMTDPIRLIHEGPGRHNSELREVEFLEPDRIAARTLKTFFKQTCALKRVLSQEPDIDLGEGRHMIVGVGNYGEEARKFTEMVRAYTTLVDDNPALKQQYHDARKLIEVAIDQDKIEGAYPSIIFEPGSWGKPPPRFDLVIDSAPDRLARELAKKTGQDFAALEDNEETPNCAFTRMFKGGKRIAVPMDHPNIGEVRLAITHFYDYLQTYSGKHDPEAHLTVSRRIDSGGKSGNVRS